MSYAIIAGVIIFCLIRFFKKSDQTEQSQTRPPATETEKMLAYMEAAKFKTNHILHLFLSLLTVGLWLIVWFVLSADNTDKRNRIYRKHGLQEETNTGPILLGIFVLLIIAVATHK
jgi:hypothetical protein